MKKGLLVLLMFAMSVAFASADPINLGDFPVGKWIDPTYDAVWSFSSDNIQLYRTNGRLVYDFRDEVSDFAVNAGMGGLEVTFKCAGTERSYKFVKGLTNLNLELIVDHADGSHHEADMKPTQILDGIVL